MKALTIILVIFIVVLSLILITRLIFAILLRHTYNNLKKIKSLSKNVYSKKKKKYIKEEDERKIEKIEFPKAHSAVKAEMQAKGGDNKRKSGSYEIINSSERARDRQELNDINIVDIVKPVGFWTSMILGQKLTYLIQSAQILNKRGDKGFWASMIEAKERAAGKQHSRGR